MNALGTSLHRQLRQLGVNDETLEFTPESWSSVLECISEQYRWMADERRVLRDSFEREIRGLYGELASDRERANQVVSAATAALALLEDVLSAQRDRATLPAALRTVLQGLRGSDGRSAALGARFARLGNELHARLTQFATDGLATEELERAGKLQRAWMPSEHVRVRGCVDMVGLCRPAGPCGGDWWTVRDLDDRRQLLLLGDATGHGADAALITAVACGAVDVAVRATQPETAGEVLEAMNDAIHSAGGQRVQMTCAAAIFDVTDGRLTAASAGHVLPYLLRANGSLEQVRATGPALGSIAGASYVDSLKRLETGDVVLWYTDGLIECEDHTGRQFGARRLRKLLAGMERRAPEHVRDAILRELSAFANDAPPVDDIAFVTARYRGSERPPRSGGTRG